MSLDYALSEIESISRTSDEDDLIRVVETSLSGKISEDTRTSLSQLAVEAAKIAYKRSNRESIDPNDIKRITIRGGRVSDSERIDGIIMRKTRLDSQTSDKLAAGKVLILDGGLDPKELSLDASIRITEPGMLARFIERQKKELQDRIQTIADVGTNLLIVRDGVNDDAIPMLRKAGIVTYRRVERDDLELIARACGASIIRDTRAIDSDCLGDFESIKEESWESVDHVRIHGSVGSGQTVIIRGSTQSILEETMRAFDDAIGVACGLVQFKSLLLEG
jgi:chaperonin GroEL (HSP60 family)